MKFSCAALEFSSIQNVVSPWVVRPGCHIYYLVGVPPLGWVLRT